MTDPGTMTFRLELPVGPHWRNVDLLRSAVLNCLLTVLGDEDLSVAVGIVTSELMENAIKYGGWSSTRQPYFSLVVSGTPQRIDVTVSSPNDPDSTHFEDLKATIAWIASFPSPRDAYVARVRAIAEQDVASGVSRMGLVRIACEGPCSLEAWLAPEDHMVHVRARVLPGAAPFSRRSSRAMPAVKLQGT